MPVRLGLAVAAAGVAVELALTAPSAVAPVAPASLPAAAGSPAEAGRPSQYAAVILARPLFSQTRRPAVVAAPHRNAAPFQAAPRLSGVLIAGAERRAIFEGKDKPLVAAVGDHLGPFQVLSIAPAQVILAGPLRDQAISIAFDGGARAPAPLDIIDQLNIAKPPAIAVPPPPTIAQMMARLPKP